MMKRFLIPTVMLCIAFGSSAHAGPPTEQLKGAVDRIIAVLKDPALKAPAMKLERRNRIFKLMEEQFDFSEMAKRSVGEPWNRISEAEQRQFEVAFSGLLERTYITKIEKYSDEKVQFTNERAKGDRYVAVHSEIMSGGRTIPLDYSLHNVNGRWLVYDVNIEGVSLVTNYRSQFADVMRKEGFKGLMSKLDEKLKTLDREE